MILEITPNLWDIITAVAASVGLGFTGYLLYKSNQTRDLQIVESTFHDILSTEERLIYVMERLGSTELDLHEWTLLFNRIEYLCLLINHGFIGDKELLHFFKNAIIGWYENWFVKYLSEDIVKNELAFPSFRFLYNLYKKELLEKGEKKNEKTRKMIHRVEEERERLEKEKTKKEKELKEKE
jgi:hypothetical protein